MKALVACFSETGNTLVVAQEIAKETDADLEQLKDVGSTTVTRMFKILLRGKTQIVETKYRPEDYDLVFLGTPIWAFSITPALRQYLSQNGWGNKKIALFCTMGGKGAEKAFKAMKKMAPTAEVVGELAVTERELEDKKELKAKILKWVEKIKK